MTEYEDGIDREGEVAVALERHTSRKQAANIDPREMSNLDVVKLGFSGLDLDLDELLTFKNKILFDAAEALATGVPPGEVMFGMWIDGIATGITIEKGRDA